jgi:hypothetical protein
MTDKKVAQPQWVAKTIAKAWLDGSFKERLIADPLATLKLEGVTFPSGTQVKIVENSDKLIYFVIPAKPAGELSDESLTSGTSEALGDPVYPDCYNQCMYCGS